MRSSVVEPLVSVIIPVYNGERFIADALRSVCAQDYPRIETIVVDDGSTDRTANVVAAFRGAIYLRRKQGGPAAARNTGIEHATGEFLSFLDCDDEMFPERIRIMTAVFSERRDVGCVLSRQQVKLEGDEIPSWLRRDRIHGDLGGITPTSCIVRRRVIEKIGPFSPAAPPAEGMEFLSRVREAGIGIEILPEVLMYRRIHDDNLTHQNALLVHALLRSLKDRAGRRRERGVEGRS